MMNRLYSTTFVRVASIIAFIFILKSTHAQNPVLIRQLNVKHTDQPIKIDGQIDDAAWNDADWTTDFHQYFPVDTMLAQAQTKIALLFDGQFLYMAARMNNQHANRKYVTPSLRRDYRGESNDGITILLDPFQDNTNAFQFGVNPFGVQREGLIANGGSGTGRNLSLSWDNVWKADAHQGDGYWTAEMAIPFKTLRYKAGQDKWNVNFYRLDSENGERSTWMPIPRNLSIITLAFMGELIFEQPPAKPSNNIAIIPYALAGTSKNFVDDTPTDQNFNVGGDAKLALTPSLNLDLTINPDFSQVEVDEQVTNLERFEIFFPERRQFFLENADLFADFGNQRLRPFFSRRIGVAFDETTSQNVQNSILGGARLSGKINQDWRVGLMNMQTARDLSINQPSTNFTVAAVQRRLFSRSNIGMIFVNKSPFEDHQIMDTTQLFRNNSVFGLDYNLSSKDDKWTGKFFYHQSLEKDNPNDSYAASGQIAYNSYHWEVFAIGQKIGENYNPEVGFARRTNFNQFASEVSYIFYPKESSLINRHGPGIDVDFLGNETYGLTDYDVNLTYEIRFRNNARFNGRLRYQYVYLFNDFDPTNTDGPVLAADTDYGNVQVIGFYFSDRRKPFFYNLSTRSGDFFNGTRLNLDGEVSYRFQPKGVISLNFSMNSLRFPAPFEDVDFLLLGPKFDFTFTKKIFWTTFIQYNDQIDNFNINSRFQWRFRPVSDLFLVYTDNYFPQNFAAKTRALVLKINYWLNI